jgi:divalent metal cation (Fe/Co/Zn/Cd) transporter
LLLGEAATPKVVQNIRKAIETHSNVEEVLELLTMHMSPKQILINAHVNLKDSLALAEAEKTVREIEDSIIAAEPKVHRIFLEIAPKDETPR